MAPILALASALLLAAVWPEAVAGGPALVAPRVRSSPTAAAPHVSTAPTTAALVAAPRLLADPVTLAAPARGTVAVTVSGLRSREGSLRAKLVRSGEGFPGSDAWVVAKQRLPIEGESVRFVFEGVPYGEYAVVCLHDEDDDSTLDRTLLGLPAEGVGFSSGARIRFGPPGFEEARFELAGPEAELAIELQYGL